MFKNIKLLAISALLFAGSMQGANFKNVAGYTAYICTSVAAALMISDELTRSKYDNLSDWPVENTKYFRDEMLKYAGNYVDQAFVDKICFKKNKENRAWCFSPFLKNPIIALGEKYPNSELHLRYVLLHELGHAYHQDSGGEDMMIQIAILSGAVTVTQLTKGVARKSIVATCGLAGGALLGQLHRRYNENRADDFVIDCLKSKDDAKTLRYVATLYRPRLPYKSKIFSRLGIPQTYFHKLEQQSQLASKFIQLIDDEHLPHSEMSVKFERAALEVEAQNRIKE